MEYRWQTAGVAWLEDGDSGRFEPEDGGRWWQQARARGGQADVAQLLGASQSGQCAHAPLYPPGFAFCPTCGAALTAPPPAAPAWWGAAAGQSLPQHVARGLPVTDLPLAGAIEARAGRAAPARPDLTLPAAPNSVCVFAAGHFGYAAQRLLALAYTRHVLQYWDPCARLWHLMSAADGAARLGFQASDYAWLPAAVGARCGEVAMVPTAQGLFRLLIDPLAQCYRTEPVFEASLASSPGLTRGRIGCLFVAGDGALKLWSADPDGCGPAVFDCAGTALPAAGWSRPLGYDDTLMWLHAEGQLVWHPDGAPRWLPWPAGWTPRLGFGGATQSRDGRLWLIGHDGAAYSFIELGMAGGQIEPIAGARLGFGGLLFRRGHPVLGDPWDAETIEDPGAADALVLPLLQQFNGERKQPSGLVLRFEPYTDTAETALDGAVIPRTLVEWIGRSNIVLDDIARLQRPGACLPFVYDDCLWLHHPDWDRIHGWRLDAPA